uniref:60S ribosomal protein L31 n=1 Tax=Steinernema glaseri TaxID=37863 RepID=A0A1I7ZFE1_9BILA
MRSKSTTTSSNPSTPADWRSTSLNSSFTREIRRAVALAEKRCFGTKWPKAARNPDVVFAFICTTCTLRIKPRLLVEKRPYRKVKDDRKMMESKYVIKRRKNIGGLVAERVTIYFEEQGNPNSKATLPRGTFLHIMIIHALFM